MEHGLGVGREPAGLAQHVRARERGVPAQVDLDLGCEPPQPERTVGARLEERGLRVAHLGGDRLHPRRVGCVARFERHDTAAGFPRNLPWANASTTKIGLVTRPILPGMRR